MTRSVLFLAIAILCLGVGLFHVKYRVVGIEQELLHARQEIAESQRTLHVLKAEWEHIVKPERLQALAEKHLGLAPFNKKQYISMSQIPFKQDPIVALVENALREEDGTESAPSRGSSHLARYRK